MKKIAALMMFLVAVMTAAGAYAADDGSASAQADEGLGGDYYVKTNSLLMGVADYTTVMVYKGTGTPTEDNIVYMDESETAFGGATRFLLKGNEPVAENGVYTASIEDGVYTIKLGGKDKNAIDTTNFYVGLGGLIDGGKAVELPRLSTNAVEASEGWWRGWNIGFAGQLWLGSCKTVLVDLRGDKQYVLGYQMTPVMSGDATLQIGIQINGVPDKYKDNLKVYICDQEIYFENVNLF